MGLKCLFLEFKKKVLWVDWLSNVRQIQLDNKKIQKSGLMLILPNDYNKRSGVLEIRVESFHPHSLSITDSCRPKFTYFS